MSSRLFLVGVIALIPLTYFLFTNNRDVDITPLTQVSQQQGNSAPFFSAPTKSLLKPLTVKIKRPLSNEEKQNSEVKDFVFSFNDIFSTGASTSHEYEKAIFFVEEFIERHPESISKIEDEIDFAFLISVQSKNVKKTLKFATLLRDQFPAQYRSKCYKLYIDMAHERSLKDLEATVLSCRGKQDIQMTVSTFIGLFMSDFGKKKGYEKYLQFREYIPELLPPARLFSKQFIEELR